MPKRFPHFVANDTAGTRQKTAVLLVGTAAEFDLVVRHNVSSTSTGFWITDALADVLYDEPDSPEPEPKPEPETPKTKAPAKKSSDSKTQKTSGDRAAKTGTDKE